MYSVVLLMALSGSADATALGHGCDGCTGCSGCDGGCWSCSGCCGGKHGHKGCCGGGGFLGRHKGCCGGCDGCTGCCGCRCRGRRGGEPGAHRRPGGGRG